jgi:hypothetical protein
MFIPIWLLVPVCLVLLYVIFHTKCPECERRASIEATRRLAQSYREYGLGGEALKCDEAVRTLEHSQPR